MKTNLSDIYEQILLNEAEKSALQNPSSDEVGNLTPKSDLFGEKPKAVEGPEKAKLQQGPSYKETTGTTSSPKAEKSKMPNSAPAKDTKVEKGEEMEDTDVDPTNKDKEKKKEPKKEIKEENFTMSAFETLFKKTLTEEIEETTEVSAEETEPSSVEEELDLDTDEESEEALEEEEGDLISDLRDLQDKLSSILSKLEDVQSEEEELEGEEEYSENDFDEEFGAEEEEEESPVKESLDKPKPLNSSKGKKLMSKKNKVGRVNPKGGKAHTGNIKSEPKPKALGDKKGSLMKGKAEVNSTIKKGDFIK